VAADSPPSVTDLHAEIHALRQRITDYEQIMREHEARIRELHNSATMYDQILNTLPDMIFVKDRASRVVYANKAFCDFYNMPLTELKGTINAQLHDPPYAQQYISDDEQVFTTGQALSIPQELVMRHDGEVRIFNTTKSLMHDGESSEMYLLGLAHDITERREAENALQKSNQRFRLLADNLPIVFFLRSVQGEMLYISPAYDKVWGRPGVELAQNPANWVEAIHPDDRAITIQRLQESVEIETEIEYRIVQPSGTVRWVSARSIPVRNAQGEVEQVAGFVTDITERKQTELELQESETRFRQMAENIGEVVWMINYPQYALVYISPSYEQVWGRSTTGLGENGTAFLDVIHPDDRERIREALPKQALGQYDEEYRIIRPDGSIAWIRDRAFPIHDKHGNVYRIVGIASNITEQKQAIVEQQRLQETIIQMQAATLAEISTPLIPISDRVMVLPLIGTLDAQRTQQVLETLLEGVAERKAEVVIVDITGIKLVDTHVANTLIQAARAVRLLGAKAMLTGIRPEVAQTLINLGIDLGDLDTAGTLQSGIAKVLV
jgi:PAS domain S-box-containing protein